MFEYIKETYDLFNEKMLESSFTINATIYITAQEVAHNTTYKGYGGILDARETSMLQKSYPLGLDPWYRVQVLPVETFGKSKYEMDITPAGRFAPYDLWVSVFEHKVKVKNNETYFDYADIVKIQNNTYNIRGKVSETFGKKTVIHIFLTKKSSR